MNAHNVTNPFLSLWALGYRNLIPIVPPDAPLSEKSSLYKRLQASKDDRGKTPGIKGYDGRWFGLDWLPYVADEDDLVRWHAMGAGVGIKTGLDGVVLIDADTLDEDRARIIRDTVEQRLGKLPVRIGRYPKVGYVCRVSEPFQYTRIGFGERNDRGELKDRVEILSNGRQFVALGQHPATKQPYRWPEPLPPLDDLPVFSAADLHGLLEALRPLLPAVSEVVKEGGTSDVDQATLRGDLDLIRKAVANTPNTSANFPTRESYRDFGYAIKAALPDHPAEAFEIYAEWCSRWQDGHNDPNVVEADWRRMKPPFRRGASYIYELADQYSGGTFSKAEQWFQPVKDYEPLFPEEKGVDSADAPDAKIKWIKPSEWNGKEPAPREWEVLNWIPKGEVTLLYGDGGIGKTLLAHQYATAAAAGLDWLGQQTRQARVMCFFCEDSEDELHRRQLDINASMGIGFEDLDENLRIASRKYMDNLFILWDKNTGAMKRQAVWDQLLQDARDFKAEVLIVDTIADTYGGSEIDRGQVNAFVKSCLGRLASELGGSVIALGHPSQSGKASGQGTSGSTAWSNAARSRLFLRYPKGVEKGDIRELEGMKLNYGPKGSLLKLQWKRGAFQVLAGTTPPSSENLAKPFGSSSVASLDDAVEAAVVSVILSAPETPMNLKVNSPRFAPRIVKRLDPELTAPYTVDEIEQAMLRLERKGAIKADTVARDASRRALEGYVVDTDKLSAKVSEQGGVFD